MDYINITAFPLSISDKLQPATRTAVADSRHWVLNCLLFLKSWKQGHDFSYSVKIENAQAQCTRGNYNLALSLSHLLSFTVTLHCIGVLQSSQGAGNRGPGEELHIEPHHCLFYSQTTESRLRSSFTLYFNFIELLSIKRRQTHRWDVCSMTVLREEKKKKTQRLFSYLPVSSIAAILDEVVEKGNFSFQYVMVDTGSGFGLINLVNFPWRKYLMKES